MPGVEREILHFTSHPYKEGGNFRVFPGLCVYTNNLRLDQSKGAGQKVKELYGIKHMDLQHRSRLCC
jgi:hypothetical protein